MNWIAPTALFLEILLCICCNDRYRDTIDPNEICLVLALSGSLVQFAARCKVTESLIVAEHPLLLLIVIYQRGLIGGAMSSCWSHWRLVSH